jgi:glycosyltransferase involved in cell wall biosynthesis
MVQSILSDPAVAAVGARLIYPSRHGPRSGPMHVPADLTVQHAGIGFAHTLTGLRPVNLGVGRDPRSADASAVREVAAATAACLLVRRSAYEAAGGFARGYDYGLEDVDLCLRLREQGGRILYDGRAAFWHHESATQKRSERDARQERQLRNHRTLLDHWAPRLSRQVLIDLLDRTGAWSAEPLHVGLTVTRDDPAAGYGDWYTAHELGGALADLGCRVSYLERHDDAWYSPDPTIDVVVGLLEAHDIRRLPGHMVTVAWIRNWTDRWLARPWFDAYDLVLTSSETSRRLVEEGSTRLARRFPIATNPERFHPPDGRSEPTVDVAFTGNHWGQPRAVDQALPELVRAGRSVLLHGKGWEAVPSLQPLTRGPVPYDRLPAVYGGARLVVDDSPPFTARYGAVNSRVFDALAAGTLVISENEAGVRELFDADFPVWHDEASLREQVDALLADPDRRRTLVERYRAMVLEQHTYAHRALELLQALRSWATAPRCRILIGVPSWEVAPAWGDTHFARDLQRQLERLGIRTGVSILPEWDADQATRADAVIHLFGLKEFRPRPAQVSLLWVISHPDLVRDDQVARFDRVFVASDRFAARLSQRMAAERGSPPPIEALHQATDPGRFWPEAGGPAHELLFVGNSRGVERAIIRDLVPTGHDLAVYGGGWTPELLDPDYLKGVAIPNEDVHRYYASAAIVLNDHWPDMRESGFLSNRLYDALASGAFVISDHVDGIEAEFDEGVITYHDRDDLSRAIERYLADPDERRRIAGRGRAAVLQRHTFQLRAAVLGTAIREAVDARPATIVPLGPEAEVDASAVVAAPTPPTPGSDA